MLVTPQEKHKIKEPRTNFKNLSLKSASKDKFNPQRIDNYFQKKPYQVKYKNITKIKY